MKRIEWAGLFGLMIVMTAIPMAAQSQDAPGWSAKKQVLGRTLYNDSGKVVGNVDDVIIAPGGAVSTAIVDVGGLLGVHWHQVAIPMDQITDKDGRFIIAGATRDSIKTLPQFQYSKEALKSRAVGTGQYIR